MKINKGMSVLLASMLISGMLVGCNDNSNTDTTKTLTKRVEVTKDKTETKEATEGKTKDKEEKAPKDDKESSSKKQVNTKEGNTDVKKDTKKKEPKKERPIYDEYGYDQYGNYDPNKDLHNDREWNNDDHKRWEESHGEDCSICGCHV